MTVSRPGHEPARSGEFLRLGRKARDTAWNLVGQIAPAPAALLAIPLLVRGMGADRFGILTLAWVVMGYFALFDLGLGRATTKLIAEERGHNRPGRVSSVLWSSLLAHAALGLAGGSLLALLTPWLVDDLLAVPPRLSAEAEVGFRLLALSIPLVVVSSALRGFLEGLQRFDLVNAVRIPASLVTYLGPLVVLPFSSKLGPVIGVIVAGRVLALLALWAVSIRAFPDATRATTPRIVVISYLFSFGGWIMVTNLITPSLASLDRFVIGARISVSDIGYYAAPYELVTKLWVLSASLLAVLFPAFAVLDREYSPALAVLYRRGLHVLLFLATPITAVIVVFAPELFTLWVDADFAARCAPAARWLALGVLVNVIAQVPFTLLQGVGKSRLTATIQLGELLVYVPVVWLAAGTGGITLVAGTWTTRALVDASLLFTAAHHYLGSRGRPAPIVWRELGWMMLFLAVCGLLLLLPSRLLMARILAMCMVLVSFGWWASASMLSSDERAQISSFWAGLMHRPRGPEF